jgi:hypothetical protein
MYKKQIIYSTDRLCRIQRFQKKNEKVHVVLDTIREKKHEEEQQQIAAIKRHHLYIAPNQEDDFEHISLHITKPKIIEQVPLKTIKNESYTERILTDINKKKRNREEEIKYKIYGVWPEPTKLQLISGERSLNDYSDVALLIELSEIDFGWAIYCNLIQEYQRHNYDNLKNYICKKDLDIIYSAIWEARRKREWVLTPEEKKFIREEREREELARKCMKEEETYMREYIIHQQEIVDKAITLFLAEMAEDPLLNALEKELYIEGSWARIIDEYNTVEIDFVSIATYDTDIDMFEDCMSMEE